MTDSDIDIILSNSGVLHCFLNGVQQIFDMFEKIFNLLVIKVIDY
jgi:hypothetical protein